LFVCFQFTLVAVPDDCSQRAVVGNSTGLLRIPSPIFSTPIKPRQSLECEATVQTLHATSQTREIAPPAQPKKSLSLYMGSSPHQAWGIHSMRLEVRGVFWNGSEASRAFVQLSERKNSAGGKLLLSSFH